MCCLHTAGYSTVGTYDFSLAPQYERRVGSILSNNKCSNYSHLRSLNKDVFDVFAWNVTVTTITDTQTVFLSHTWTQMAHTFPRKRFSFVSKWWWFVIVQFHSPTLLINLAALHLKFQLHFINQCGTVTIHHTHIHNNDMEGFYRTCFSAVMTERSAEKCPNLENYYLENWNAN